MQRRGDDTHDEDNTELMERRNSEQHHQPSSPTAASQHLHQHAISKAGYNSFLRSCVMVFLVFVTLIVLNSTLQKKGVLPPAGPGTRGDTFILPDDTSISTTAPAPAAAPSSSSAPSDDNSKSSSSPAASSSSPSSSSSDGAKSTSTTSPPSLPGNALYFRQPKAIFQDVMRATDGFDSPRLQSHAAGVFTELSLDMEWKRGNVQLESDVFSCFNKYDQLRLRPVAPSSSGSVMQPPLLVPAAGGNAPAFYRYDFVLLPVGCFGDAVRRKTRPGQCRLTSCVGIAQLSKFVSCGRRPIGLILGDNFYPKGIESRDPGRLAREFTVKFLAHASMRNIPWYGTVGNHDVHPERQYSPFFASSSSSSSSSLSSSASVASAQQQRRQLSDVTNATSSNDILRTWIMPAAHHVTPLMKMPVDVDATIPMFYTLQIFFVSSQWGGERNKPHMAAEATWLDTQLSRSTADIKIVASHEPIFNFANFAHSQPLVDHIHPVLVKHGVPLYISAHAHSVQFHRCTGGYYQLVSAGFADNLHPGVRYKRPRGHYFLGRGASAVAVNGTHVVVTAFDLAGRHVFDHTFDWRKTTREVNAWNSAESTIKRAIEENEVGGADLWTPDVYCRGVRMAAPWCAMNKTS